jgi:hypothetical protein
MMEGCDAWPVMCSRMHPGGHGRGSTGGGLGGGGGSGCVTGGDTGSVAPVSQQDMVPVDASTGTVSCQASATSTSSNASKSQQSQSILSSRCATVISRSST